MRRFLAGTISALAFAGSGYSQDLKAKWPAADAAEPARLADQLGDRDYRVREQAGKRLHVLGADALPALRQVAGTGNLEATERAADLIARIEWRLANAKTTAGSVVELPAGEQTLGAAFDAIRKQTGYTIQINGDQSPRARKVTPKPGRATFWEALDALATAANLEVEISIAPNGPIHIPAYAPIDPKAPKGAPPLGTVMLRPKSAKSSNPFCISGAFRIEAVPVAVSSLPAMPVNRVPLVLQITPEPKLRWLNALPTLVAAARDQDGRPIVTDFVALDTPPIHGYSGRRVVRGKNVARSGDYGDPIASSEYPATPFQAYVKLLANPEGPSTVLKTFDGVVRGRVWSQPETMLAISGLSVTVQEIHGPNRTGLKAKFEPMPGDASALLLSVTTAYNSGEVIPHNGSSALTANPDGLWLENGPGGRVTVKLSPEERERARGYTNAYGLALVDGRGKPMNLSPHTASSQNFYDQWSNTSTLSVTAQYVVRPADKADADKPAKLTFNGTRVKAVEVPFALKDVPVLRGAGTAVNNQPVEMYYSK